MAFRVTGRDAEGNLVAALTEEQAAFLLQPGGAFRMRVATPEELAAFEAAEAEKAEEDGDEDEGEEMEKDEAKEEEKK